METADYPAAGSTGLALTVGELREKVARLKEELARAETNLRDADAQDKTELSSIDQHQQTSLDALTRDLSALTERIAALETKAAASPAPTPPAMPKRQDREGADAYRSRVAAWARQHGKPEPPKTGALGNGASYGNKVARFYGAT